MGRNKKKKRRIEAIVRTWLSCATYLLKTVPCRSVKAGAGDPRNYLERKHQNKTCRTNRRLCSRWMLDIEYGITSSADPESKRHKGSACVVLTRYDQIDSISV
ncbi:unnamed protein product [Fusarium venenatum]|uniref:Uncharacterized protein n=1 Tax=Fusarium venenatum TaxID=56646 RepID=A0A2L2TWV9_9HYPO|nr:uncharacterized protein FVRRES_01597 [Fusarium venenatum]CEI65085.1 unnamed protein product [Fusarium venenatum]